MTFFSWVELVTGVVLVVLLWCQLDSARRIEKINKENTKRIEYLENVVCTDIRRQLHAIDKRCANAINTATSEMLALLITARNKWDEAEKEDGGGSE